MTIKEIQETFREIRELRKKAQEKETRDKLKARAKAEHVRVGRLIDEWMGES